MNGDGNGGDYRRWRRQPSCGRAGPDEIRGLGGSDILEGVGGDDFLDGGEGDDLILAGGAGDRIVGGAGADVADYSGLTEAVMIVDNGMYGGTPETLLVWPADDSEDAPGTIEGVETIIATDHDDLIVIGMGAAREVHSGAGNDLLFGSFFDDVLDGGDGNDILAGLWGDDVITTGDGVDFIYVDRDIENGATTGHGHDVVTDFDVTMDVLIVEYDADQESYDPFADLTQTAEGALLTMADDSSILLLGVDVMELNAMNLMVQAENNYLTVG